MGDGWALLSVIAGL